MEKISYRGTGVTRTYGSQLTKEEKEKKGRLRAVTKPRATHLILTPCPPCPCELRVRDFSKKYLSIIFIAIIAVSACSSKQVLKDPPIITSATQQHTLYNGKAQPIEAETAKADAPPRIVTYFRSEADLQADRDGTLEAPTEVGVYYVRIRRPAGNGYRAGPDITVEYRIQRALAIPFTVQ